MMAVSLENLKSLHGELVTAMSLLHEVLTSGATVTGLHGLREFPLSARLD